jgi:uncharacterized membrane protein YcaP (DUF421 family)
MRFHEIALRTAFAYVFLLALTRISGKRLVLQASSLDLVVALVLSDMFDNLFYGQITLAVFTVSVSFLLFLHVAIAVGCLKNEGLACRLKGSATHLARNDSFLPGGMKSERLSERDVLALARQVGVKDLREFESIWIERSGGPGYRLRTWARPARKLDLGDRGERR